MLKWVGTDKLITNIPKSRKKFYALRLYRLSNQEYLDIQDWIQCKVDESLLSNKYSKFVVPGWKAPKHWDKTPLDNIWYKCFPGDAKLCALWYGLCVMDVIISRKELWFGTKVDFGRSFQQTVYWTYDTPV